MLLKVLCWCTPETITQPLPNHMRCCSLLRTTFEQKRCTTRRHCNRRRGCRHLQLPTCKAMYQPGMYMFCSCLTAGCTHPAPIACPPMTYAEAPQLEACLEPLVQACRCMQLLVTQHRVSYTHQLRNIPRRQLRRAVCAGVCAQKAQQHSQHSRC
jgi:hypothetical protein